MTAKTPLNYRLGLDLGTGSLGWSVFEIDEDGKPFRVVRTGSRIFGTGRKPKDNTTLAGNRTQARSMRRRRDRYIQRREHTLNQLAAHGLFPADKAERKKLQSLHPFRLRHEGLRRELTPHELGRALFHLQQRRGFKSNRKADKGDSDSGAMKMAIATFKQQIPNGETVGSYLWEEVKANRGARARRRGDGTKVEYDFYVDRAMIDDEFESLWAYQQQFHPSILTAHAKDAVKMAIFDQRPLKPMDPGKCFFERDQQRAPRALPSSQRFRILQELNNLRVQDVNDTRLASRALTRAERDKAFDHLLSIGRVKFGTLASKVFGRNSSMIFNLEAGERAEMNGDVVGAAMSKGEVFGDVWRGLTVEVQDDVVSRILGAESEADADQLIDALAGEFGVARECVDKAVNNVRMPDGHMRLSTKAIRSLLPHLENGWDTEKDQALTYDKAAAAAGYHHSEWHAGVIFDELPYYGEVLQRYAADVPRREDIVVKSNTNPDEWEYGRIANPTVHIGLNQVRLVVNAIIAQYGKPAQIHVEVARELGQSKEARAEASRRRSDNQKRNDALRAQLASLGEVDNHRNRERLKLYEELAPLNHVCVFTGERIDLSRLFTNEYQVDHILPFSRTLDDSFANKILIHQSANQKKGNLTPFEAYGASERWDEVLDRSESLPFNKRKRFAEDALEGYNLGDGDFIARQLTDTAYLARVTRQYLGSLYDNPAEVARRVIVLPGRLTAMLRGKWGLNSLTSEGNQKDRHDHRHHAIDAAVVAATDRRMLKAMTDANVRAQQAGMDRLLQDLPMPWETFREDLRGAIDRTVVSHKPDHGVGGQLHEETAYGVLEGPDKDDRYLTHKRVDGEFEEAKWRAVIPIFREGESPDSALPYKAFIGGSNFCIEIVRQSTGRWAGEVISRFQANQRDYLEFMSDPKRFRSQSFSGLPLVMRLIADDTIAVEVEGERKIMRLYKIASQGTMYFAGVVEGNVPARVSAGEYKALTPRADPLRKIRARRVFVDPLGNVFDPGFRE